MTARRRVISPASLGRRHGELSPGVISACRASLPGGREGCSAAGGAHRRNSPQRPGRASASIVTLSGQRRPGIHPADRDFVDEDDAPKPTGPTGALRPAVRARRLRRLLRRRHEGSRQPRHRATGHRRALQPRAPRRDRAPRPNTGDGAGILLQIPDRVPPRRSPASTCPPAGAYAVGLALPARRRRGEAEKAVAAIEEIVADEGLRVLGWRDVPVEPDVLGATARQVMPGRSGSSSSTDPAGAGGHRRSTASCSAPASASSTRSTGRDGERRRLLPVAVGRTLVYKGMLTTPQLGEFFPDLADERVESALALVHSRFSTNTFPSWPLAHPYRYIAHNGEINTVQGNRNWMRAREALLAQRPHPRRPRARLPDLHARRAATRPASTRCSSCCTSAAARCPTPC